MLQASSPVASEQRTGSRLTSQTTWIDAQSLAEDHRPVITIITTGTFLEISGSGIWIRLSSLHKIGRENSPCTMRSRGLSCMERPVESRSANDTLLLFIKRVLGCGGAPFQPLGHWAAEASSMHHGMMPTSFSANFMLPLMKLVSAKFDMRNEVRFNAERSRSPGGWYSDAFAP